MVQVGSGGNSWIAGAPATACRFVNSSIGLNFIDIIGGSGGPSFVYAKPYWEGLVYGVPADGKRDLGIMPSFSACQT